MLVSNIIRRRTKGKNVPKFIKVVFTLTRINGVFPFKISCQNTLEECNGILYTFLPILLTSANVTFLLKNIEDFSNEKLFTSVVQMIIHLNSIVYVLLPFFNKTIIRIGINASLSHIHEETFKKRTFHHLMIVSCAFVIWIFVIVWQPVVDRDIFRILLCVERVILGSLEVQICFLLCFFAEQLVDIKEEVKNIIYHQNRVFMQHGFGFGSSLKTSFFQINDLENCRKKHLTLYKAMKNLNAAYGLANFMLTMRERFSFAFHLYCWISYGKLFDLILGTVNFFEVFLVFYSFQRLKNEERDLKRFVKQLDSDALEAKSSQLDHFRKQIRFLDIKFEACGLFSMDLNMIISIITTTAGYLLLLNQLNI